MMPVNWNPDRDQLRSFGLVCLAAFGALGTWVLVRQSLLGVSLAAPSARGAAVGLWTLAAVSGLLALAAPAALRPLYRALTAVSLPIGYVVSHAVMAVVFFGVLMPIALVFRLMRRDPLCRRPDPGRPSYWDPRVASGDVKRYYRQF